METHRSRAIFQRDVYGRLRTVRERKQEFSQGGVLSDTQHHLTKHGSYPLIRPRIRLHQMHGEAGSAPCLGYNFRTKLKVRISSPSSLCQEIREVRKPSRYTDSWQTAEIRAKMSVWLVQAGFWFHVLLPVVCYSYSWTTKSVKGQAWL